MANSWDEMQPTVSGISETLRSVSLSHGLPKILVDIVGPLSDSNGFSYALVSVDIFNKRVTVDPLKEATTDAVIDCLGGHVFRVFGVPSIVITDHGCPFNSIEFKTFINEKKTHHWYTSDYAEFIEVGAMRLVTSVLRSFVSVCECSWVELIPDICSSVNSALMNPLQHLYNWPVVGEEMEWSDEENTSSRLSSPE